MAVSAAWSAVAFNAVSAALTVSRGVNGESQRSLDTPENDSVGQVLDRVDRLAVVANQGAEVITEKLARQFVPILLHPDLGLDAHASRELLEHLLETGRQRH